MKRSMTMHERDAYHREHGTSWWTKRRERALKLAGYRCQDCGREAGGDVLQVHHLNYDRYGAELDEDLRVLCRECHRAAHHPIVVYDE